MRVAVDICNTIANVNLELLRYFNISLENYPFPNIPQGFFETKRGLEIFAKAEPFPGSQKALAGLFELGYRIEYITSRPTLADFVTKRWLTLHGFPPGRVIFASTPEEKARNAIRRCYDVFFEDDPRVIKKLIGVGIEVFVKDWQYNRSLDHSLIIRFKRWNEVPLEYGAGLGM